jgi:hypothetical protein
LIPNCFQQKANRYGGGEAAARSFLKIQASPVFQKLRRLAFKLVWRKLLLLHRINIAEQEGHVFYAESAVYANHGKL